MEISSSKKYKHILIVKLSAIGDVIHALPVAHALKRQYPEVHITWIVEKTAYDLLTNNPDIDDIIIFEKSKFKTVRGLIKHLPRLREKFTSRHFDIALDLQGLFKSAAISAVSGAKRRIGYCNMREGSNLISIPICGRNQNGHIVDRYLDVIRSIGCSVEEINFPIYITETEKARAIAIASQSGLKTDEQYVILAPSTNWPTKCWPIEHFAVLANKLYSKGIRSAIIGSASDAALVAKVLKSAHHVLDLTGKTTLKELAYLIERASLFVGGDTGPMHLAVAMKTPVVALFGPTDAARNGPYGNSHTVLTSPVPCAGCWKRNCPKTFICMENISVDSVYEAIIEKLGEGDKKWQWEFQLLL